MYPFSFARCSEKVSTLGSAREQREDRGIAANRKSRLRASDSFALLNAGHGEGNGPEMLNREDRRVVNVRGVNNVNNDRSIVLKPGPFIDDVLFFSVYGCNPIARGFYDL